MLADFFPWVFPSFFSIDAFSKVFMCASKDVMHDPDFFEFSMFSSNFDAFSAHSSVSCKIVMHDLDFSRYLKSSGAIDARFLTAFSNVQVGTRRPYRWWKACAIVAENAK